jgi:hypothetical protein
VVKDADGETAEAGDVLRTVAGANAATVLIEIPVDDPVTTIFDDPMAAIDFEQALWAGLFRRSAGDAECGFERSLPAFFVDDLALNQEDLANVREIDIGIGCGSFRPRGIACGSKT